MRDLTPQEWKFIATMLESRSVNDARLKLKMNKDHAYKLWNDPRVQQEFQSLRKEQISEVMHALSQRVMESISNIVDLEQDSSSSPTLRLNASKALIDYYLKVHETLNIESRLAEIESRLEIE